MKSKQVSRAKKTPLIKKKRTTFRESFFEKIIFDELTKSDTRHTWEEKKINHFSLLRVFSDEVDDQRACTSRSTLFVCLSRNRYFSQKKKILKKNLKMIPDCSYTYCTIFIFAIRSTLPPFSPLFNSAGQDKFRNLSWFSSLLRNELLYRKNFQFARSIPESHSLSILLTRLLISTVSAVGRFFFFLSGGLI